MPCERGVANASVLKFHVRIIVSDFTTARARIGGLKGVMKLLLDAPEHDHKWKNMPKCPFCGNSGSAGIFTKGGTDFFKCHHTSCSSGGAVLTEVGYIAMRLGLSESKPADGGASPAYRKFLEMAGCWEETKAPASETKPKANGTKPNGTNGPEPETNVGEVDVTGSGDPAGPPAPASAHPAAPDSNGAVDASKSAPSTPTPAPAVPAQEKVILDDQPGLAVLREFYKRLRQTDEQLTVLGPKSFKRETLFEKRGLERRTCRQLGFCANPRDNEKLLQDLLTEYAWEEVRASGLWLEADAKRKLPRRPNTQFCGKGQMGKKANGDRRNKDDKWLWGWCEPVLIPYFNEAGKLMKLRPHKGGAPSGTMAGRERIYVPRDYRRCADPVKAAAHGAGPVKSETLHGAGMVEKFFTVVICEGEYKAAAVWQTIGAGRPDGGEPVGACAIPGISFARNIELRADLETWLEAVGCRKVIVAFDDEDKSNKPMRLRHDAVKYARYLAIDLANKLHLRGTYAVLPQEWRNAKGKADWDGALAGLLKEPTLNPVKSQGDHEASIQH